MISKLRASLVAKMIVAAICLFVTWCLIINSISKALTRAYYAPDTTIVIKNGVADTTIKIRK